MEEELELAPMYPLPPNGTELGDLALLDVFDHYDYPQSFSCQDATGRRFLAFHVEEPPATDTWLFLRVSALRLAQLEHGEIDLHESLIHAEDGFLFRVTQDRHQGTARVDRLPVDLLPAVWVPATGQLLRRPSAPALLTFEIMPADSAKAEHLGAAIAHVRVGNNGPFVPRVRAGVRFKNADGTLLFDGREMPVRWSSAPEPFTPLIGQDGQPVWVPNPSLLAPAYVQDFARGEAHLAGLAIRFVEGAWGFTADSYFKNLRHPDWKLPSGNALLEVRVQADGVDHLQTFILDTSASVDRFKIMAKEGARTTVRPAAQAERVPGEGGPPVHLRLVAS